MTRGEMVEDGPSGGLGPDLLAILEPGVHRPPSQTVVYIIDGLSIRRILYHLGLSPPEESRLVRSKR